MVSVNWLIWGGTCACFVWGMVRFFVAPRSVQAGTALTAVAGAVAVVVQGVALAVPPVQGAQPAVGLSLVLVACALFWWAIVTARHTRFMAIFGDGVPTAIVQHGPYRWVRHPFYVAYSLFWCGGWAMSGAPMAGAAACAMVGLYVVAARGEERVIASSPLRDTYAAYRAQIRLKGLWRWRATGR